MRDGKSRVATSTSTPPRMKEFFFLLATMMPQAGGAFSPTRGGLGVRTFRASRNKEKAALASTASTLNFENAQKPPQNHQNQNQSKNKNQSKNQQLPYNWKEHWYPVSFLSYLPPTDETVATSVFNHRLVLWRTTSNNKVYCADDRCPHRAAALSVGGRVLDNGNLECMYHGWQFNSSSTGNPVCIPQVPSNAKLPTAKQACLKMRPAQVVDDVIWVWMGDTPQPPPDKLHPPITNHGNPDQIHRRLTFFDYQCDFAVDHSFIIENVIDPAHIPHSHAESFGDVKDAQPLEMELTEALSSNGFGGRFRRTVKVHSPANRLLKLLGQQQTTPKEDHTIDKEEFEWDSYEFRAPNSLYMTTHNGKNSKGEDKLGLLTFHVTPLTAGRSRLLFRLSFANAPPILHFITRLIPTWISNLGNSKSLEEDLSFIMSQQEWFASQHHNQQQQLQHDDYENAPIHAPRMLRDDYTPLPSADVFVVAYRQWLDAVGHGMPWFWGFASRNLQQPSSSTPSPSTSALPTSTATAPVLAMAMPIDPFTYTSTTTDTPHTASVTRYNSHVIYNPAMRGALRNIRRIKRGLVSLAVFSASLGFASVGFSGMNELKWGRGVVKGAAVVLPLASLGAGLLHGLEQKFYTSFTRKKSQRGF